MMSGEREKGLWVSIISALFLGFFDALFVIYLRLIVPSVIWNNTVSDSRSLLHLLTRYHVLWLEQAKEISLLLFILLLSIFLLSKWNERVAIFLIQLGTWKGARLLSLYLLIDWPKSFMLYDTATSLPYPILIPVWMISFLALFLFIVAYSMLSLKETVPEPPKKRQKSGTKRK